MVKIFSDNEFYKIYLGEFINKNLIKTNDKNFEDYVVFTTLGFWL